MPWAGWKNLHAALFVGSEVRVLGLLPLRVFPGTTDPTFLGSGKVCCEAEGLLLEAPGNSALTPHSWLSPRGEGAYKNTNRVGRKAEVEGLCAKNTLRAETH